jgi:hypothetical protein
VSKFDLIEQGFSLSPYEQVSRPPRVVPQPRNVRCVPRLITGSDGSESYSLDVSWDFPLTLLGRRESYITSYYVEFKRGRGAWGGRQEVSQLYARYENVGSGRFFARVAAACSVNRKVSLWSVSGVGNLTTVQAIADASSANYSYFVTEF